MNKLEALLQVIRKYENIIHQTQYSQFTIDFIQNTEMKINNEMEDEDLTESYVEDIIGSVQYQTSCILEIIKDGKDKDLFLDLEKGITPLNP